MIGGTVGLVSSVGRAPDLQAGGRGFESCIGHTFSFTLVASTLMQRHDVAATLIRRCVNVACPLGYMLATFQGCILIAH